MSNTELQQMSENARRILTKPNNRRHTMARDVLDAISAEWERRASQSGWFPWPSTDAPGGNGNVNGDGWPTEGMLSYLGYRVGETNPTPVAERRLILEYIFEKGLPPLNDPEYYFAWGRSRSCERLKKLANTIASLTRNAKRRDPVTLAKSISDWEGDLNFLHQKYYVDYFDFGWPPVDSY